MVHLILASTKGNGVRYFPYSGYLGLTSVKLEGVVITKRDADLKLLPAKSLTVSVRCYESRLGRVGVLQSNVLVDLTQVLWSKPDGQDYADIGDTEHPFRITIPVRVGGFSAASLVEYRCVWRVEAVLNHSHVYGVGSRQIKHSDLPLLRYDLPPCLPSPRPPLPITKSQLDRQTSKLRGANICYCINAPKSAVGPTDLVPISIYLLPDDPGVVIRSGSIIVERRIHFNEPLTPTALTSPPVTSSSLSSSFTSPSHLSSALPSLPIPIPQSPSSSSLFPSPSASFYEDQLNGASFTPTRISSSNTPVSSDPVSFSTTSIATETRPLLPQSRAISGSSESLNSKCVVLPIAGTESSGPFARAENGIWSKTLTVQWPAPKSNGHWGIGETVQSDLASIRFFARVKLVVSTPFNTESIELDEEEILVVSTSDAERRLAMSKSRESLSDARSKSKSPRRSRRERENAPVSEPPVPSLTSVSGAEHSHKNLHPMAASATSATSSSTLKGKGVPRRPHTSAGPRDKSSFSSYGQGHGRAHEPSLSSSPPTSQVHSRENSGDSGQAPYRRRRPDTASPTISTHLTKSNVFGHVFSPIVSSMRSSASSISTTSTMSASGMTMSDTVKEWEEELARIEIQSRRSSDLLGFGTKRKRLNDGNNNKSRPLVKA